MHAALGGHVMAARQLLALPACLPARLLAGWLGPAVLLPCPDLCWLHVLVSQKQPLDVTAGHDGMALHMCHPI